MQVISSCSLFIQLILRNCEFLCIYLLQCACKICLDYTIYSGDGVIAAQVRRTTLITVVFQFVAYLF